MTDEVIIDSSAWIHSLQSKQKTHIYHRVNELIIKNKAVTVPIVIMELLGGTKTLQEFQRLKDRLSGLIFIDFSGEAWEVAAKWAFEIRRIGITVPNGDILISAVAFINDIAVLHADKHFNMIGEQYQIKIESMIDEI